jgi:ribonuclease HII
MPRIVATSAPSTAIKRAIKTSGKTAKSQPACQTVTKTIPKAVTKSVTAATAKQRMLKQLVCSDAPEQALRYRGFQLIAGVDEVGRGALFGPVVAAAVILPEAIDHLARAGLKDSKQMLREDREAMDLEIRSIALAFSVAEVSAEIIDRVNIYQATRHAMLAAVEGLGLAPDHLLIDAMRIDHRCAQTKLIYGDSLSLSIAAASVLAKVHRDALMRELDLLHPQYGLASHKGYATPAHRRALVEHGPCPLHRRSFSPALTAQPTLFDDSDLALELLDSDDPEIQEEATLLQELTEDI